MRAVVGNTTAVACAIGPLDRTLTIGHALAELARIAHLRSRIVGAWQRPVASTCAGIPFPGALVDLTPGSGQAALSVPCSIEPLANVEATVRIVQGAVA